MKNEKQKVFDSLNANDINKIFKTLSKIELNSQDQILKIKLKPVLKNLQIAISITSLPKKDIKKSKIDLNKEIYKDLLNYVKS